MIILNLHSETPIYTQLCQQIIKAIATGEIAPEEPLPTVRQLAEDLGINTMTVNKAYGQLKQWGYLESNSRKGSQVRKDISPRPDILNQISETLSGLTAEAFLNGVSRHQFLEQVNALYDQYQEV